jgi:hypothetical protein
MSSEFYPSSTPIYGHMVSGARIQRPDASVLKSEYPKPFGSRNKKVKKDAA